jgi:monoamine oxidase
MKLAALLLLPLLVTGAPQGTPADDLARIQAEPHPDKRAHLALDNAGDALKQARDTYDKGDNEGMAALVQEVERSVELAESSLKETGKNPSRSPKHFKYAELKTRELLRKLASFREGMSVADRPALDRAIGTVQKIHDALLDGIMGKKK